MQTVRKEVFETNSSSTHSITMCTKDEYERWKKGELYYFDNEERFLTKEERDIILKEMVLYENIDNDWSNNTISYKGITKSYIDSDDRANIIKSFFTPEEIASVTDEQIEKMLDECYDLREIPCTYDEYWDNLEYETYETSYITKSGEEVVAFGYYGYDG